MAQHYMGFDVGGTKIEATILAFDSTHSNYKILARERIPTERDKGYRAILEKFDFLFKKIKAQVDVKIEGVGFGLPGTVDPKTHSMLNGNTGAFVGHKLKADLEQIFSGAGPIELANDANCFALAEVLYGVGRKFEQETGKKIKEQLAIGVILGTGCGSGVIWRGEVLEGANGGTGEIGHSVLVTDGRPCFCGRKGCAELYVSGSGLETEYALVSGNKISGSEVFARAEGGEAYATQTLKNYCAYLAQFIANVTNIIDPDYFVFGGGVSQQDIIYKTLEQDVGRQLFLPVPPARVYKNTLGDSAGVIGAALLPYLRQS